MNAIGRVPFAALHKSYGCKRGRAFSLQSFCPHLISIELLQRISYSRSMLLREDAGGEVKKDFRFNPSRSKSAYNENSKIRPFVNSFAFSKYPLIFKKFNLRS